jgi:hypothetical protein
VDSDEIAAIGADLDLDLIHAKMDEEGITSEDYLGFEVWPGGNDLTWAMLGDDTMLMGPDDGVKACLLAISSGATAYASSEHIRDTLDRMSEGIMDFVMTGDQFYPGSLYAGITVEKISFERLKMRGVMKFADEEEAAMVAEQIGTILEYSDGYEMTVSQSGNFVEYAAEFDMDEDILPF